MRVCFMGSMDFAVPILEGLNEKFDVVLVVTQPDKPVGRKQVLTPTKVKQKAMELNLKLFQPVNIRLDYEEITSLELDFIIVAAYGQMIPDIVLEHARHQAINVHASLLPKYRGGSPMHRAIQYGDKESGVTVMFMAKQMDSGDILSQSSVAITLDDNVASLERKLSIVGRDLLMETLEKIDHIIPQKQDISKVTFAYNIQPKEEKVSFDMSALEVYNHVRAFNPWPLTYCVIDDKKIKLYNVEYIDVNMHKPPGEIVRMDKQGVFIQTQDGLVLLKKIQLQGKTVMDISDFMNGVGKTLFTEGKVFE